MITITGIKLIFLNPVYIFGIQVELIIAKFILNPEQNE
jgi:hypothetical protein